MPDEDDPPDEPPEEPPLLPEEPPLLLELGGVVWVGLGFEPHPAAASAAIRIAPAASRRTGLRLGRVICCSSGSRPVKIKRFVYFYVDAPPGELFRASVRDR
jgi:hypothetical protein